MIRRLLAITLFCVAFSIAFFSTNASAHHMSPDEVFDFITDQLIEVDSPHLLSSEDDPSLLDAYADRTTLEDLDLVFEDTSSDLAGLLDAIETILLQLEDENDVIDFEVLIYYDPETDLYTVVLLVDIAE